MQVSVVYAPSAREVHEVTLNVNEPCCVLEALRQSGLQQRFTELQQPGLLLGVWGRQVGQVHALRELDRVEVYRPLRVDPKVARRERFVKQGARNTGLFVKKRPGAKAGY